jgi:hypothetical protein
MSAIKKVGNTVISGTMAVLVLLAAYLSLTALPAFLGLTGVYYPDPTTAGIADALARLFVSFICYGLVGGLYWIQNRVTADDE